MDDAEVNKREHKKVQLLEQLVDALDDFNKAFEECLNQQARLAEWLNATDL